MRERTGPVVPSETPTEFFIGYLDTPPNTKRFALTSGLVLTVFVVALGVFLALGQRRAGTATWDITQEITRQGILQTKPYGMLHQVREDGTVHTTLLVEATKFGLRPEAARLSGQTVRVTGTLLVRADEDMLALSPGVDAVRVVEARRTPLPSEDLGTVQLTGRAVDSKCFLGAMKPGDGAGHRPCAQLCIKGGIPPLLITNNAEHPYVLIADADGNAVDIERILPKVAELHQYAGRLSRVGAIEILRWER